MGQPIPLKAWRVFKSAERIEAIREYFITVWKAIKAKRTPARPYTRDAIPCQYCRFNLFCWRGIPEPPEEKLEPDETIEDPGQEIVESAAANLLRMDAELKRIKKEMEIPKRIIEAHFKRHGKTAMVDPHGGAAKISYVKTAKYELNKEFLAKRLGHAAFVEAANITMAGLQALAKAGRTDGTTIEKAKIPLPASWSVRIFRPKEKK
jgi:hypothetical protein